ncbi:MAG: beta-galactosidase [Pelomonas sp.]|nr:beta-galactosidase [Roseateles sp.]
MKRWAIIWAGLSLAGAALGQQATVLGVDASAPVAAPLEGVLHLGSAVAPDGTTLGANSRYLTRNGRPWLPVMGEFHYSRSPAPSWADELRKMKAAGVTIVSTYVIWNHHEATPGRFDWRGNRDLRRFVQLAAAAGLEVVVRVGPWDHAEARFGGVPDWVVDAMPTRRDDPSYLHYVARLYEQIGAQLHGLMWKDGGPVVGVQIENEYNLDGPGQGAQHIATLKKLARAAGLDAPFYTVTGWDGAVYPSGEVTPVFGGYPDEPWGTSTAELPPKETYAFRFDSRVSGDLGAQTAAHAPGTAERDAARTPFLGAEFGAGLPAMYRRRTLVSADDIAAMLPVQLGSGVNLMGYYMFHGGRNPVASPSLEESSGSGGYNDTPRITYDFNAPLGPDGEQREVLARLRPFHLFLAAFGERLAPMTVRRPDAVPASPADLTTPRWSVRADGAGHGFVFVNNHVRQYAMAAPPGVRFEVRLKGETRSFPSQPVTLADGAYFIWPFNFDLDGTLLRYATAQPLTRIDAGKAGVVYVFAASAGVPAEFAVGDAAAQTVAPGLALHEVGRVGGRPLSLLVLTPEQSRTLLVGTLEGRTRLVLSETQAWFDAKGLQLRSTDAAEQRVAVFPALAHPQAQGAKAAVAMDGAFQTLALHWPARALKAEVTPLRAAGDAPPVLKGGLAGAALAPIPEAFKASAAWTVTLPSHALDGLADVLIEPDFTGDIARLFDGTTMLDDWYFNGQPWQIGLRGLAHAPQGPLTLSVLPLRADAPIYLDRAHRPDFAGAQQFAQLRGVTLHPVYAAQIR